MPNRLPAALSRAPMPTPGEERRAIVLMTIIALAILLLAASCSLRPAYAETCIASHYGVGDGLHGRLTASGERLNAYAMTAAHKRLSFGSIAVVRNVTNGRSVTIRINDRGPFVRGRCIDLSYGAARAIGCGGTCKVEVK